MPTFTRRRRPVVVDIVVRYSLFVIRRIFALYHGIPLYGLIIFMFFYFNSANDFNVVPTSTSIKSSEYPTASFIVPKFESHHTSGSNLANDVIIFDMTIWRDKKIRDLSVGDRSKLKFCNVPDFLRIIAAEICAAYGKSNCNRLPCSMIYSLMAEKKEIKCGRNGLIGYTSDDNNMNLPAEPLTTCKVGYSLDLFLENGPASIQPSILIDAYTQISIKVLVETLNTRFRSPQSVWGFYFNFESITNYPWAGDSNIIDLFNITYGYDRRKYDFIPTPWLFDYVTALMDGGTRLKIQDALNSKRPIATVQKLINFWPNTFNNHARSKIVDGIRSVTAPIIWMNSNCNTPSKRTEYMDELMNYIDVDNYGNCGRNIRELPESIVEIQQSRNQDLKNRGSYRWLEGKLALTKNYLFTIAIENSIDYDYITEKLWHPFVVGSIPIYFGAPNIDDWLPCENDCIIDLRRFSTPKHAAEYIIQVATNKTLYESFHRWRTEPIRPKFKKILDYFDQMKNYDLSCMICDASHRIRQGESIESIKNQVKTKIVQF